MTAQRRSWMLRAVMLVTIVAGSLAIGVPAWADAFYTVSGPTPALLNDFRAGDSAQNVKFTVTNVSEPASPTDMTASLTVTGSDFDIATPSACTGGTASSCTFSLDSATPTDLTFAISPKATISDVPVGTTKAFTATFTVTDGTTPFTTTFNLNMTNPAPLSVSGEIYDISTGAAIPGALVNLQDSAAHSWLTTTDSHGKFSFASTPTKPIVPGQLIIGASKDRYKTITETMNITTKPITSWRVPLKLVVVATPSASLSGTPTPSTSDFVFPSDGASTDASGGASDTGTDGGLIGQDPSTSGGSGLFKYVLIMGVILVLGGAGVIAFMFYRRKKDEAGPPSGYSGGGRTDDSGPRGGGGGSGGGGGRPGYRPAAGGPTMVSRSGPSDAATMMHSRAAADEFADPYGAPPSPRGPRPGQPAGAGHGGTGSSAPRRPGGYNVGYDPSQYPEGATSYRPPASRQADQYQSYQPAPQPSYAVDPTGYMTPPSDRSGGHPQRGHSPAGQRGGYQPSNDYGNGYPAQAAGGYPAGGPPNSAYPEQGYPNQSYPSQGYPDQGYAPRQGYPDQGYPAYQNGGGYASGGHEVNGYGSGGYDANGYDALGYNADGYDPDGYDAAGYNAAGYNAAGYNAEGYHVAGYSAYPGDFGAPSGAYPQQDGYSQNGYQQGGYRGGYTPPDQRGSVDWLDD